MLSSFLCLFNYGHSFIRILWLNINLHPITSTTPIRITHLRKISLPLFIIFLLCTQKGTSEKPITAERTLLYCLLLLLLLSLSYSIDVDLFIGIYEMIGFFQLFVPGVIVMLLLTEFLLEVEFVLFFCHCQSVILFLLSNFLIFLARNCTHLFLLTLVMILFSCDWVFEFLYTGYELEISTASIWPASPCSLGCKQSKIPKAKSLPTWCRFRWIFNHIFMVRAIIIWEKPIKNFYVYFICQGVFSLLVLD